MKLPAYRRAVPVAKTAAGHLNIDALVDEGEDNVSDIGLLNLTAILSDCLFQRKSRMQTGLTSVRKWAKTTTTMRTTTTTPETTLIQAKLTTSTTLERVSGVERMAEVRFIRRHAALALTLNSLPGAADYD